MDGLLKVTTDNAYDIYGRLTGIAQVKGITPTNPTGTPISDDVYVLDNLNRLQTQTKGGQVKEIGYDKTDQVQTVTGGAGEAYTYDLNGNRTNGGYTTGVDNRLTSDGTYSYLYDPEGNRQSRTNIVTNAVDEYTWDYRNRLTGIVSKDSGGAVIKTVGYAYDVDDQRVSKTVTSANAEATPTTPLSAGTTGTGSTTEKYYLDGNQIAFVTDGGGNQMFHYLYGLNVDQVMAQDSPAGMVWALADRLGSVETITDGEGVVVDKRTFDSFGRVLSESNPSVSFRYGYTGRDRDLESGLDYYRARYYDSQVGRFISVDPMGFGAGDTNLYRYVGNNSTNATDPTGMIAWSDVQNYAYGGLENTDKFVAGFADLVTGGYTTKVRNDVYGDRVAGQHEGLLFNAGQVAGFGVSVALGFVTPNALASTAVRSISAAERVAQGYAGIQAGIGAFNTTTKIQDGKMDWSSPLSYLEVAGSFAPLIGAGARQLGKLGVVENAIARATAVGENVWNGVSSKLGKLNRGFDDLRSPNQLGIEYARPPENFSYTGDPLDFVPGKLQGLANRKMRTEFREEAIKLGVKSDNILFTKQGGSGFNPGAMAVRVNKTTATPGTLADEFAHIFNKVHGKGTYLSDDLAQIHVQLAKDVKRLGSTSALGQELDTLYHQLELKNLINSGKKLPSFIRAIPQEEIDYFLNIPTNYEGKLIIPGSR